MAIPEVIPHIVTPPELPITETSNSTDIYIVSQSGTTFGQTRETLLSGVINSSAAPTGTIVMYGAAAAPTGWLKCDWTSYVTTDYPDLYALIGYTYGNDAGKFRVPDFRGRAPIGVGTGIEHIGGTPNAALTARTLGSFYGYETDSGTDTPTISLSNTGLTITVTVAPINYSITPSGTVTVDSATLTVDFSNATIPAHEETITSDTHDHTVTTAPINVAETPGVTVADDLVYTTSSETVDIDLSGQALTHTPTGTQDLSHDHNATFTGSPATGTLTATATATTPTHTHTASSSAVSITIDVVQPVQCVNFIIKT